MLDVRDHNPSPGWVYVMECQGLYKIGWSTSPKLRRSHIQTANPHPVTLVGVVEGPIQHEGEWHRFFKDKRIHNEWFALTEEDVAHVLADSFGIDYLPDGDFAA